MKKTLSLDSTRQKRKEQHTPASAGAVHSTVTLQQMPSGATAASMAASAAAAAAASASAFDTVTYPPTTMPPLPQGIFSTVPSFPNWMTFVLPNGMVYMPFGQNFLPPLSMLPPQLNSFMQPPQFSSFMMPPQFNPLVVPTIVHQQTPVPDVNPPVLPQPAPAPAPGLVPIQIPALATVSAQGSTQLREFTTQEFESNVKAWMTKVGITDLSVLNDKPVLLAFFVTEIYPVGAHYTKNHTILPEKAILQNLGMRDEGLLRTFTDERFRRRETISKLHRRETSGNAKHSNTRAPMTLYESILQETGKRTLSDSCSEELDAAKNRVFLRNRLGTPYDETLRNLIFCAGASSQMQKKYRGNG